MSRTIEIGANVEGRDLGSVAEDIEDGLEDMKLPLGYHAEVSGEYKERQESDRRLLFYGLLAAIGIFFLLLTSFRSARLAALSFFTLPMALVGGVLAAFFFGDGIISLGSLVGFFTILGIVARNGIMQISHFQHLEQHEGETFGPDARAPRREGAAGADPDDRADHRARPGAAADRRQHPRPGDRVPDGDRHRRRPGHLDAAQPVRRAVLYLRFGRSTERAARGRHSGVRSLRATAAGG